MDRRKITMLVATTITLMLLVAGWGVGESRGEEQVWRLDGRRSSYLQLDANAALPSTTFVVAVSLRAISVRGPALAFLVQSADLSTRLHVSVDRPSPTQLSFLVALHSEGAVNISRVSDPLLVEDVTNATHGLQASLEWSGESEISQPLISLLVRTADVRRHTTIGNPPTELLGDIIGQPVFVGGIPEGVRVEGESAKAIFSLAPLAACVTVLRSLPPTASQKSSATPSSSCELCQEKQCAFNGGSCQGKEGGAFGCDCRTTTFGGPTCQKESETISFTGQHCSMVHVGDGQQISRQLSFLVRVRADARGTVFDSRHVRASLVDGLRLEVTVKERGSTRSRALSVGAWHHVTVVLATDRASVTVDGARLVAVGYAARPVAHSGGSLTLGCAHDANHTHKLAGACLTQFVVGASLDALSDVLVDSSRLKSVLPGARLTHHHAAAGAFELCYPMERQFAQLVQFTTLESRLEVTSFSAGSLFVSFRTSKKSGLLAHGYHGTWEVRITVACGKLQAVYTSSGETVQVLSEVSVDDNTFHSVRLERLGCRLALTVDERRDLSTTASSSCFSATSTPATLYLGGSQDGSADGFVGCVRDALVDGEDHGLDILVYDSTVGVKKGCGNGDTCAVCQNQAACTQETIGVRCDCTQTSGYMGPTCSSRSVIATFSGEGVLEGSFDEQTCQLWRLALQFRPNTTDDSVLFRTIPDEPSHALTVRLLGQNLTLELGSSGETVVLADVPLVTGDWNQLLIVGQSVPGVFPSLRVTLNGDVYERNATASFALTKARLLLGGAETGHSPTPAEPRFSGCLRHVVFQDRDVLQALYDAQDAHVRDAVQFQEPLLSHRCEQRLLTCPFGEVLFAEAGSHMTFNPYAMVRRGQVEFSFKTNKPNGLVLATRGDSDYLYVQLEAGRICAYARLQGEKLTLCVGQALNDVELHTVAFTKRHHRFTLAVDQLPAVEETIATPHSRFALDRRLLVGTVYSTCFTNRSFVSYSDPDLPLVEGFAGCLRGLKVNGLCSSSVSDFQCTSGGPPTVAPMYKAMEGKQLGRLFPSCNQNFCDLKKVCLNGGFCYNAFTKHGCDCRGTGYTGESCEIGHPGITFPCHHYAIQTVTGAQQPPTLGADKPGFVFVYRSHKQPATATVALASFVGADDSKLIQILQRGDKIVVESKLHPAARIRRAESGPIPSLKDFEYHIIHVIFRMVGREPLMSVLVYRNRGDAAVATFNVKNQKGSGNWTEVRVGTIELGSFDVGMASPAASDFSSTVPLCGHIREARYNDVGIIREVLARSNSTRSNAVMAEEVLENHTIFIASPAAYKQVKWPSILAAQVEIRAHGSQDSVLFNLGSSTNTIVGLLHEGALVIEDTSILRPNDVPAHRVTLRGGGRLDDGEAHLLAFSVDVGTGVLHLRIDGEDYSRADLKLKLSLRNKGFETFEIGGSSTPPSATTNVTRGYTGCLDNVMLNSAFVNLRKATTKGGLSESDITDTCPRCIVSRRCANRAKCYDGDEEKFTCDCAGTGFEGSVCDELPGVVTAKPGFNTAPPIVTGKGGSPAASSSFPWWIIPLVILLLLLLALLVAACVYLYLRYKRRYTGMFAIHEKLSQSGDSDGGGGGGQIV